MYYSIIGWIGVIIFIGAYLLLSLELLSAKKTTYHWLNAVGGVCLVINSYGTKDFPSLAVNAIWALIAVFTCSKLILHQSNSEK